MPSWKGVDCGHFVSCQFGWAGPFPRTLFPTLTWLGWAAWESLLRHLESQDVATAISHTLLLIWRLILLLGGNHRASNCSTFLWSLIQFLWFLDQRWRFHMSHLLQFYQVPRQQVTDFCWLSWALLVFVVPVYSCSFFQTFNSSIRYEGSTSQILVNQLPQVCKVKFLFKKHYLDNNKGINTRRGYNIF